MRIDLAGSDPDRAIDSHTDRWKRDDLLGRLWRKDPTVWGSRDEPEIADRLGWLDLPHTARRHIGPITDLAARAIDDGIETVVLVGMGGSSLAPETFSLSLPQQPGSPRLVVLDSTHPDAVRGVTNSVDLRRTWFIVSSKSGTTIETLSLMRHFLALVGHTIPDSGSKFIAVTDPGSELAEIASAEGFRAAVLADPTVGGRYSALSAFGLVPAGIVGCDINKLLGAGAAAAALCGVETPVDMNPGFRIGATMAAGVPSGVDKVRFVGSGPGIHFGPWAEQLIAESTGKDGTGIVPIDDGPERSGADDETTIGVGSDTRTRPTDITITWSDPHDIAAAMYLMEFATAVAGEVLGINPFNQPDVQRAKALATAAMDGTAEAAPPPEPIRSPELHGKLSELLESDPSYVSIQAYLSPDEPTDGLLRRIQEAIVDRTGAATTVGYGPRFLHSTGQLHKGGPSGGVFLQLVDTPAAVVPVPGSSYDFGALIGAQADGDRRALAEAGRAVLSVDLGTEPAAGLIAIANAIRVPAP
ncbi:MAG: glucose-6-phosphate isomerase [Acidimicrobiia bacterium]